MTNLSVYIHLPFCRRRCNYCDFVSCCGLEKIDAYVKTLCSEILTFQNAEKYLVQTVYFGGGTPSILPAKQIRKIFDVLSLKFKIADSAEISIEANPDSITAAKLKTYKAIGINRISIGVQSFNNETLKLLGRLHTAKESIKALRQAAVYFDNISIDLIIGLGGPLTELTDILGLIDHISVYSLTVEPGTVIADKINRGELILPADEEVITQQRQIEKKLFDVGFYKYEVSNYAKKGYECKHNKAYWTGMEYVGFGAAAHSLLGNFRYQNTDDIDKYITGHGFCLEKHSRTADEILTEQMMLGLRTCDGIPINLVKDKHTEIELLRRAGLIKIKNDKIIATDKGLLLLNQIIIRLSET